MLQKFVGLLDLDQALRYGQIVTHAYDGQEVNWLITNPGDEIQKAQLRGPFYELRVLEALRNIVGECRNVADIGANVGNHAVYFSKFLRAQQIVIFEMNPRIIPHLLVNCALNYSSAYDFRALGVALGERSSSGQIVPGSKFNQGSTRIIPDETGEAKIKAGDGLLGDMSMDLLKIDVEGMELAVLRGLRGTIERERPHVFVETTNGNFAEAVRFLDAFGYTIRHRERMYDQCENVILTAR